MTETKLKTQAIADAAVTARKIDATTTIYNAVGTTDQTVTTAASWTDVNEMSIDAETTDDSVILFIATINLSTTGGVSRTNFEVLGQGNRIFGPNGYFLTPQTNAAGTAISFTISAWQGITTGGTKTYKIRCDAVSFNVRMNASSVVTESREMSVIVFG